MDRRELPALMGRVLTAALMGVVVQGVWVGIAYGIWVLTVSPLFGVPEPTAWQAYGAGLLLAVLSPGRRRA